MIKIIKFIFAAFTTFILFELFFQSSEIILPPMVTADSTFGRKLIPCARINWINESFNISEVNEFGHIGKGYPVKKEKKAFRIALIGDSFVEGLQVKDDDHFRTVLENELNSSTHKIKYEVLNFGRSGLDFRKMYIYYELLAKNYKPDLVLIFVEESDFRSNDYNLGPKLITDSNNSISIDNSFRNSWKFQNNVKFYLFRKLSLYSLLKSVYANFTSNQTARILLDKFYFDKEPENEEIQSSFEKDTYHNLNNKILMSYASIQTETKTKFIIIPIKKLSDSTVSLIKNNHLFIISLENVYHNLEGDDINAFYWKATNMYGHWNQEAHKQIGRYLANKVSKVGAN